MPSSLTCPEEAELLAVTAGEEPSDELRMHLSGCPLCLERLGQLNLEVAMFRENTMRAEESPSTVNGPAHVADGQANDHQASRSRGRDGRGDVAGVISPDTRRRASHGVDRHDDSHDDEPQ